MGTQVSTDQILSPETILELRPTGRDAADGAGGGVWWRLGAGTRDGEP